MAKVCEECGYQTWDDMKTTCPVCGAKLQQSTEMQEQPDTKQKRFVKPKMQVQQFMLPIILIVIMAAVLLYVLTAPDQVREQMTAATSAVQRQIDEVEENLPQQEESQLQEGESSEPQETIEPETDPSGNEILTDFEIPGVVVQPEYVLAESARSLWTVSTVSSNLNLRAGPSTDYDVVGKLSKGTQVTAWGYSTDGPSNWIVVEYNGQYGWACTDYLQQVG